MNQQRLKGLNNNGSRIRLLSIEIHFVNNKQRRSWTWKKEIVWCLDLTLAIKVVLVECGSTIDAFDDIFACWPNFRRMLIRTIAIFPIGFGCVQKAKTTGRLRRMSRCLLSMLLIRWPAFHYQLLATASTQSHGPFVFTSNFITEIGTTEKLKEHVFNKSFTTIKTERCWAHHQTLCAHWNVEDFQLTV